MLTLPVFVQGVHLHICVEESKAAQLQAIPGFNVGGLAPTRIWGHAVHSMEARLHACFNSVRQHAIQTSTWPQYKWVVRSRPDIFFFKEARALLLTTCSLPAGAQIKLQAFKPM